jgi:hypothetical protein
MLFVATQDAGWDRSWTKTGPDEDSLLFVLPDSMQDEPNLETPQLYALCTSNNNID